MAGLRKAVAGASLALALAFGLGSAGAEDPVDLDQGWNQSDIDPWYRLTQGSRLIPLSWLEALEQAGSTAPFLDPANVEKYRYLAGGDPPPSGLPLPLPLGFAVDSQDDGRLWAPAFRWKYGQGSRESWVGLNCAACHTEELEFGGRRVRVEGGPTLADFQGFMEAFNRALVETRDQPGKFARFAAEVLKAGDSEGNRERYLRPALKRLVDWQLAVERMNLTGLRYGYSRLDAFGHIFNKVALVVLAAHPTPNPADAPVRYPVLWNVPQEDFVQWNASAPRILKTSPFGEFDAGALARNTGELIGVFGDIHPDGKSGFVTSIRIDSLVDVEHELGKLRPPKWPEALFGAPEPAAVARGEKLYADNCLRCHALLNGRADLTTTISVTSPQPYWADTDLLAACNARKDTSASGVLAGTPVRYAAGGAPLPAMAANLSDLLSTVVIGVLKGQRLQVAIDAGLALAGLTRPPAIDVPILGAAGAAGGLARPLSRIEQRLEDCRYLLPPLGYKTRPLDGIWAAAPYLHNGSVPTLHDLLSPPGLRPKTFWEGTRQFDPKNVGYAVTTKRTRENDFEFDARQPGNSNLGHDYGASNLSEEERMDLIAYLKTL